MTLAMAWVRTHNASQELVVISDSRLRSCGAWDSCPKIMPLPRGDCVLAFAGSTMLTYPVFLQVYHAVSLHRGSRRRILDLETMKGRVQRLMNDMIARFDGRQDEGNREDLRDTRLFFGGWSWRRQAFVGWVVRYDFYAGEFSFEPMRGLRDSGFPNRIAVIGDPAMSEKERKRMEESGGQVLDRALDVVLEAKRRLAKTLPNVGANGWNMEPFAVLRDMIREPFSPQVGGPVQMAKVYRHCNAQAFAVAWPNVDSQQLSVLGRPLLPYERLDCPILDPDTCEPADRSRFAPTSHGKTKRSAP